MGGEPMTYVESLVAQTRELHRCGGDPGGIVFGNTQDGDQWVSSRGSVYVVSHEDGDVMFPVAATIEALLVASASLATAYFDLFGQVRLSESWWEEVAAVGGDEVDPDWIYGSVRGRPRPTR